jgi:signal transduction histidine kinase
VLWIGLGLLCTGIFVSGLFRWNLEQSYHDELRIHIEELAGLTELQPDGQPFLARRLSDPRYLPAGSGFYWQVERAGYETQTSPSLGNARLEHSLASTPRLRFAWLPGPTGETLEYGKILPARDGGAPVRLLIATDRRLIEEVMTSFNSALASTLTIIAGIMLLGGMVHIGFALYPLRRLTREIANIREGLTERMLGGFPSEIQPLVDDVNSLLATKEERAAHNRLRASNLAHGLRTPLTILMNEGERLEATGHKGAGEIVLRETERMSRHINYHLARARTAIEQPKLNVATSLTQILSQLVPALSRLYCDRNIKFQIGDAPDLLLACDAADLFEMLSNLLDNAGKWATSQCKVDWSVLDGFCHITISDDGPGISSDLAKRLFKPGERLDDTIPGTGLGLAVTYDLATHYGGRIWVEPDVESGCTVSLTLPIAAAGKGQAAPQLRARGRR